MQTQSSSSVPRRTISTLLPVALLLGGLSACSDSVKDDPVPVASIVQDLTLDPRGRTLMAELEGLYSSVPNATVEVSDGQIATSVAVDGDLVEIIFDRIVSPEHQIRFVGVPGVDEAWRDIGTTDPRTPLMSIIAANQDTSDAVLGGDTIQAVFVAGPRVIEADAENPDNWALSVDGVQLDLTGSVFILNPDTQRLGITLGTNANLHSSFQLSANLRTVAGVQLSSNPVTGAATGDSDAPGFEGGSPVVQNLDAANLGDEFGRVVELDFDEPISPVFGVLPSNFGVVDHPSAVGTTSVARAAVDPNDNSLVRVVFTRPVVPGLDQIQVDGVVDAHGNAVPAQVVALEAGSTVANSFTSVDFITREGTDNDQLVVTTAQALDPDTAANPGRWSLTVGGIGVVDLSAGPSLDYSLTTRTLTVDLGFDAPNGATVDVATVGAMDVDGEDFTVSAVQTTAAGDAVAPSVLTVVQNRSADATGQTVDVSFSEEVDVVIAADPAKFTFSPAIVVNGATVVSGTVVRLTLADVAVPGDHTLTVAQAITDPAGNDLGSDFGPTAFVSTDLEAPSALVASGRTQEGASNDVVTVLFNDRLVQSEVEASGAWTFESPIGTSVDVTGSTIAYSPDTGVATVELSGPTSPDLRNGEPFRVAFTGIRDVGGNTITATPIDGTVAGEVLRPEAESAFIVAGGSDTELVVRFSEAMRDLDDLYDGSTNPDGVRFTVHEALSASDILPQSATVLDDGMGVQLTYGLPIDPASTLDVVGTTDLAGNILFPVIEMPVQAEDATAPAQMAAPTITAVTGVENDTIVVQFSVPMSASGITSPEQYEVLEGGTVAVDLSTEDIQFDGVDTVTIVLNSAGAADFQSASTYDFTVRQDAAMPLRSLQGVAITAPDTQAAVTVQGDVTNGPTQGGSVALTDPSNTSVFFVVFDETVDTAAATNVAAYDFNSGTVPTSVSMVGDRTVRVEVPGIVSAGQTVDISTAAAVDSAGNAAAGTITLAVAEDLIQPTLNGATATIGTGFGGDRITLTFSEELDLASALNILNYTATGAAGSLRLSGVLYDSSTFTVTLGVEDLVDGDAVSIFVDGVTDLVGNLPLTPLLGSATATGDATAPDFASAFVNLAADSGGLVVEALFDEVVDPVFLRDASNWSTSGTATVVGVEVLAGDQVQLLLSEALGATDTVSLAAGLQDSSRNEAGQLTVDPVR